MQMHEKNLKLATTPKKQLPDIIVPFPYDKGIWSGLFYWSSISCIRWDRKFRLLIHLISNERNHRLSVKHSCNYLQIVNDWRIRTRELSESIHAPLLYTVRILI